MVICESYKITDTEQETDLKHLNFHNLSKLSANYNNEQENNKFLKTKWNYESLNEYPCYLCVRKMLNEGADKGQRNFWHGRIVNMLKQNIILILKSILYAGI